jgi:hypothetical protein
MLHSTAEIVRINDAASTRRDSHDWQKGMQRRHSADIPNSACKCG